MTGDDRPRRRRLSAEEQALWRGVTRSVAPLKRRRVQPEMDVEAAAAEAPRKPPATPAATAPKPRIQPPRQPPLTPLDRRARQQIARGTVPIDARLDLHGRTQSEAHDALLRFLRRAQDKGAKVVLVITGKGGSFGDTGRGVLRRQVPLWLALPEFRSYVLGVEAASASHGGEGALYVRVRRAR